MRRIGLAALSSLLVATGCSGFRDVFTSHAETAARVGSRELSSARVAEVIGRLGGPGANPDAAPLIAGIWADMNLFADRVAEGTMNPDSALMARLMWPHLTEQKIRAWHDTLIAHRTITVSPDSAYSAGDVRLFQHILFMPAGTSPADTAKAKASAERVAPQAKSGDFAKLAAQYSGDGSKTDKGMLPPGPRGMFVPEFETAAWALAPGEVTGVVKSQFGFHIIRRPRLEEVRDRLEPFLKQQQVARIDSTFMADLEAATKPTLKPGAAAAIRSAASDPGSNRRSRKELVSYKGGSFTVGELVPWLEALPLQSFAQIRQANDTILEGFAKSIAQNEILLAQADSAKVEVQPIALASVAEQFKSAIAALREGIGLDTPEFSDSSKTPTGERRKLAATKVEEYFDKLTKGEAQFRQIPPTLSAELRREGDYKIFQPGLARAKELILAQKAKDSAAAGGAGTAAPPPGLQPAPAGPPVGGGDTTKKP